MRTIVITGANTGIGRETAAGLVRPGDYFILAGRSLERTQHVIDELTAAGAKADFVEVDLASLASVRAAAARIRHLAPSIELLINNAGIGGNKLGTTPEGFEIHFGVNHLGHFLLTQELLPILKSSNARIVNVASDAHRMVKALDFDALKKPTQTVTGFPEYGVSKLCNILFTRELAKRTGLRSYALHPGVIATEIWREVPAPLRVLMKLFMRSPKKGAQTSIYCATADIAENGTYFEKSKQRHTTRLAQDEALARELWDWSERWVAQDASSVA